MGKIENQAARVNMWSALIERSMKIVSALGGWTVVAPAGVALLSGWTALVHWIDHLPFWLSAAAGLLLLSLTATAFTSIRRAWAIRGVKKLDLRTLGADCVKFREDVFDFLLARQEVQQASLGNRSHTVDSAAIYQEWEKRRDFGRRTSGLSAQKFAARAVALVHMLTSANIPPPSLWAFDHELPNIAAHVGAVGELLERGLIDEARGFTNDRNDRLSLYLG